MLVVDVAEVVDVVVVVVVSGNKVSNRSRMKSNSPKMSYIEKQSPRLHNYRTHLLLLRQSGRRPPSPSLRTPPGV